MLDKEQIRELAQLHGLLYASAIGLTAGMTATMFYSLGAFIPHVQGEFGWSRGDISLAVTFLTFAVFITGSTVGRLCDRYGAALVGALSLLLYALAIVLMVWLMRELYHLWLGYFIVALLGVGSTPIVLVRPVTTGFYRARGIALGVALTGAGVAGFWVPQLVVYVSEGWGWRYAYLMLAAIASLAAPVVWLGFRKPSRSCHTGSLDTSAGSIPTGHQLPEGISHQQARRKGSYWLLSLMAFAMACGIAGVVVHMQPLFIDLGAAATSAARIAATVGIASVAGRLLIGYLLDRMPAVPLSISVLILAAAGISLLWYSGLAWAYVAAALLGLAAGAEIDLLAYLTVSYFGRRHYGAIYGWQYSVFAVGYGLSPFLVGLLHDISGSYGLPLLCSALLLGAAALCCLGLPSTQSSMKLITS